MRLSSELKVSFIRDVDDKVLRMDYIVTGFPIRTWFGIYLNDVLTDRFRTNNQGELIGYLEGIPTAYDVALTCVSDINAYWSDSNSLPTSGVVYGCKNTIFVELDDDDGENQDRVGVWSLDVRYD